MAREINRRDFVKNIGLGAAGLMAGSSFTFPTGTTERPNILLILVDQMRTPRWFPRDAHLPAFERLQREGISFTNHFTSAVPCSPSRATLFTGLHQPQHGIYANIASPFNKGSDSLDTRFVTLGHSFKNAGYRTPYIGKWHISTDRDLKVAGLAPYGFEEWRPPDRIGMPLEGLRHDDDFAYHTVKWLKENGKKYPWFLTCSLINPHDIMFYRRAVVPSVMVPDICEKLPGNFDDDLEGKPRIQKQYRDARGAILGTGPDEPERVWRHYIDLYYYLQKKVDGQIGKVLDALDRLGLSDDTLVIFTSDHGEMAGSHKLQGKANFVYNENNQVPLIFRWPGRIKAGARVGALTQSVDFYPTLLALAGLTSAPMHAHLPGKSLLPVINDPLKADVNDHILMSHGPVEIPKLFERLGVIRPITAPQYIRAIFDGRYKYARYFNPGMDEQEYELYDLVNDPLEMKNLAGDPRYRSIEKEMADRLREAEASEMAPLHPGKG